MEDSHSSSASLLSLKTYLATILPSLLTFDGNVDEDLSDQGTSDCLNKFCSSIENEALYVESCWSETDSQCKLSFSIRPQISPECTSAVAFIKTKANAIESSRPINQQLQVMTLFCSDGIMEDENLDRSSKSTIPCLLQYVKHSFTPLTRAMMRAQESAGGNGTKENTVENTNEIENISNLQRKVRDVEVAFDQCYRGTEIPVVHLQIPASLLAPASATSAAVLKGHIEKYNASQVDQFFKDLGLNTVAEESFQSEVNVAAKVWPSEIKKQVNLTNSSFPGTAEKEVNLWKDLGKKLSDTKAQLDDAPALLTKLVLKKTNRVSEQLIKESETDLDKAIELVEVSIAFLRDFPIEDLMAATSMHPQFSRSIGACLGHFSKLRHSNYDLSRAVQLIEVLGKVTHDKITGILRDRSFLQVPMTEFKRCMEEVYQVFMAWDNQYAVQRQVFADVAKRRHEKIKTTQLDFTKLRSRLTLLTDFREQHEKLVDVLSVVLSDQDNEISMELSEAYKVFLRNNNDPLDISIEGDSAWSLSHQLYEKRLEKTEERITRLLSDRLDAATSAEEMFRVFATFNPLFFRPAIRHAVNSFRNTLVKNVREDVKKLKDKFKFRYEESQERATAQLRGIPPLSGRIVWARQIENQLSTLMKRMEDVLGVGWEEHFEGKQLKEVCDELRGYLDPQRLYKSWREEQLRADYRSYNRLKEFILLVDEDPVTLQNVIRVNFEQSHVELFKEVRYLDWLLPTMSNSTTNIPASIRSVAREAYTRYPVAVAIQAALASFANAKKNVSEENAILLISYVEPVREVINEAMGGTKKTQRWVKWDSPELNDWVLRLSSHVNDFQDRACDLQEKMSRVDHLLKQLIAATYDRKTLEEVMTSLQLVVDEMQRKNFANMSVWVDKLDKKIEAIICDRVEDATEAWLGAFVGKDTSENDVQLYQTVHEIALSSQVLSLSPPIEQARVEWLNNFHVHISIASTLPRIISGRGNIVFGNLSSEPKDYSDALKSVDRSVLKKAYGVIEDHLIRANEYTQQWLQYQALWDVSVNTIADKIGRNIKKWQQLLTEIKAARSTIESSDEEKSFGPIVINYRQVQNKINLKYDIWQKDSQVKFALILGEEIKTAYSDLMNTKGRLESVYLEGPTKDVIAGVELILKTNKSIEETKEFVSNLETSEKLLLKQRYKLPGDWVRASNVSGVLSDLLQVLARRTASMESQLPLLEKKISEEDESINVSLSEFFSSWKNQRPVDGKASASEALKTLATFSDKARKIHESIKRVWGAKAALGIQFLPHDEISMYIEEIDGLRDAWQSIAPSREKFETLRSSPVKGLVPAKIRKQVEEIQDEVKAIPSRLRSYECVQTFSQSLAESVSLQSILRELCSEALKERHWRTLLKSMKINEGYSSLTLGKLWDTKLSAHKKSISEVLTVAQGELALEQFLRDTREYWQTSELQLVIRDNTRAITGWDVLFGMLEDHLNSLASLKQSPYFRNVQEFQEETMNWENRLTSLRAIFDVWVEVQRKWLYLRGIFRSADIKSQLPAQYTRFKGVENEFTGLMKKVSVKPGVLDLVQIENLHRLLERLDTTMGAVQKALGEYLEKQRQIFPRFYFVNNDDLVEIIGNNNEQTKIFPFFVKMFAAVNAVGIESRNGDALEAVSILSREGEVVELSNTIDLKMGVKEWLAGVEAEMVKTLAEVLEKAVTAIPEDINDLVTWVSNYPAQIVLLASQIAWSEAVEGAIVSASSINDALQAALSNLENKLKVLSEYVLKDLDLALRKKCEQLITEIVHQRDVSRLLISSNISPTANFEWLYHLRFYWNPSEKDLTKKLCIKISNAQFFYGFEYLGIGDRLVQTPLTDRCYLTLTQALHFGMGGNPFGPAGTGKTESVKMLGSELGRFVLVFNCDENFDYAAMGRIFAGLCQVGAWGCFDEFNRLEERILSAVSQQILTIQKGLMARLDHIDLMGSQCKLNKDVGIFVTMNPGYAGRSNLPDNLKLLFRAVAMTTPDRRMITQVMLFSQGIVTAESLAGKITLLFTLCEEQLSMQSHYDFGLRALKSVLMGAGELKRAALSAITDDKFDIAEIEKEVLIKATCNSILPKLVAQDIALFTSLLSGVFPNASLPDITEPSIVEAINDICMEDYLECKPEFVTKMLQLKQVLDVRHGVMLVGPSGSGKSSAWKTLLKALTRADGIKGDFYIIDPKSIKKDKLYGTLDPNTLEWSDGTFTKILRKIIDNTQNRGGTTARRSWIVFDGDVDPEWAENLNSVLDDNKVLTLPSGDRLKLPPNVRIMMEVDSLQHATLATVSRCGMVWFAEGTVTLDMLLNQQLNMLRRQAISFRDSVALNSVPRKAVEADKKSSGFVDCIVPFFTSNPNVVELVLKFALEQQHVMEPTVGRLLSALYSLLVRGLYLIAEYNEANPDFPMTDSHLQNFSSKWLMFSLLWGFGGSMPTQKRELLGDILVKHLGVDVPSNVNLTELQVIIDDGSWLEWTRSVPPTEIETHRVTASDAVVTTVDTIRHMEVLKAWLSCHIPLILCGPPGSGKTMTLTSVIDSSPEFVLASLNFSSGTTPDLIIKTFAQYCETIDSPEGLVMQPNHNSYSDSKWLVIFCDEVNLPEKDKYGTQRVVMFIRQLVEQGGYWNSDSKWIRLRRIQFICACNPPTDTGRVVMSSRFLRHAPLLLVDYPAETSLKQIYSCFNSALLKLHSNLKGSVNSLTDAMVEFYMKNQKKFTTDAAPQYIYSPRELSRWVRALYEAIEPMDALSLEELVRLWAHEALRLFHDRLISTEDKRWCDALVDEVAEKHFPGIDFAKTLQRPMLYTNWLRKKYEDIGRDDLTNFLSARLNVFYEEELDVPLVVFDDVLEHVLRIDNVLRHPMGHMLLVGEAGAGKTVLSRFVAWINGLSVYQIKANRNYTLEQFDEDLKGLMRRVAVDGEKICFIFDESNVLSSAFLERMNALLASGEVPGLFEGDELTQLLSTCRDAFSARDGLTVEMDKDLLWRRFTKAVQSNLHVIFTMNPASSDFQERCTTSPALFNRCVVDWFGTWSSTALAQVASEFTKHLDTGFTDFNPPSKPNEIASLVMEVINSSEISLLEAVVAALVSMHDSAKLATVSVAKTSGQHQHYLSPRDYLDLINKFISLEAEKRTMLQDQQTHIRRGLEKMQETSDQVAELRKEMVQKESILKAKDDDANKKLAQMVDNQNAAEHAKTVAENLTVELRNQEEEIKNRKVAVQQELSEAEPALQAAKQVVQGIKKSQMDEVRGLVRPPNPVRMTMEMVCVMIGEKNLDWAEIRKVIRSDDFIAQVVNFDPIKITQKQAKKIQEEYLNNPEMDHSSVDRASKACGPLFRWAESQINYANILRKIKPLRDEVEKLQEQSKELKIKQKDAVEQVAALEKTIDQYKMEYASAIRETETIRSEMTSVTKKVDRAQNLLQSLEKEKDRWVESSTSFDNQMSTLIGDCLLSAAFMTYGGIFDHKIRRKLLDEWSSTLHVQGISFRDELDLINYLSTPADLLTWRSFGLPSDELTVQNAILLERFNRFPLVIDPSGQATNFLLQKYASRKIAITSFMDPNFMKTIGSAIRFGTPLLVNDAETVDPILNPILNKELQKMGGRTLIRLGNEDIDFSPKFVMILITRDPYVRLAPDLCSRITLVNFSVTPDSLESQTLSAILKAERSDVDVRRTEVLKLQGEQSVRIRELEESLLDKISAVHGAILDDDTVINTLESIQSEAEELNKEVAKTEQIMNELKAISAYYEPLAASMASVYFSIEKLASVSFLYQFNLQFFLDLIARVLSGKIPTENKSTTLTPSKFTDVQAVKARVQELTVAFFKEIFRRILISLQFNDKLMFAARLSMIFMTSQGIRGLEGKELDVLLRDSLALTGSNDSSNTNFKDVFQNSTSVDDKALEKLTTLSTLPSFSKLSYDITANASKWSTWISSTNPEEDMSEDWMDNKDTGNGIRMTLLKILIIKILRPDRLIPSLDLFVQKVFGDFFNWRDFTDFDLKEIVVKDSHNKSPIMLCSQTGHGQDASGKIDTLARASSKVLLQVAMGSAEGYTEADRCVSQAAKLGQWVLLNNTHLCTEWLEKLEKRVLAMQPHESFRLFLACEITPLLPSSLLRLSDVVYVEESTGIKANMTKFFKTNIPNARFEKPPVERSRLYVLLAWLNAIILERLRYVPMGWTKRYEFNEADSVCALDVIDLWVDNISAGKAHIDPKDLPWQALRTLLSQSLYGGRVDNSYDQAALDSFIVSVFNANSYEASAPLAIDYSYGNASTLLTLPDGFKREAVEQWIDSLPDNSSPLHLGLPSTAENQLQSIKGNLLLTHLGSLVDTDLVEAKNMDQEHGATGRESSDDRSHLRYVSEMIELWKANLPGAEFIENLKSIDISRTSDASASPIERSIRRELARGLEVMQMINQEISSVLSYCTEGTKTTNVVRQLFSCFMKGTVPPHWKSELYFITNTSSLNTFMTDLGSRCKNLENYYDIVNGVSKLINPEANIQYWLGGMFHPEAFLTATRQQTAQKHGWSLEELELSLDIGVVDDGENGVILRGLVLENATWNDGTLLLSNELKCRLEPSRLCWRRKDDDSETKKPFVRSPIYLTENRKNLMAEVRLSVTSNISTCPPTSALAQRGVAIIMR